MTSERVLEIFKEITRIPRESGHEEPMTEYLCNWAKDHNLPYKRDEIGNVCITKPASKGKENAPTVVLQAHQDMVCEKLSGCNHDFLKDPIHYEIEDGWMIAKETTLGADDGIGVAACLALMESDKPMGQVESIFTISEETGMDGANAMQPGFFTGKILINLDSEDEGQLFIGCAGGENSHAYFSYTTEPRREGWTRVHLKIDGGIGGHSGDDINKHRANTVQILAKFLKDEIPHGLQLFIFSGGGKSNAIARECEAYIAVPDVDATKTRFEAYGKKIKKEYAKDDPDLQFVVDKSFQNEKAIDSHTAHQVIECVADCPHGVVRMSPDIKGLVQTSTNLAAVSMKNPGEIRVVTSQRSSVVDELDDIVMKVSDHFRAAGAMVDNFSKYPGWNPNLNSPILAKCVESYKRLFNQDPLVLAIHAGLECGLFLEKFPDLDMISFGPTLRGVHAPGEKLELASMDKFVELLDDVVCNL